MRRVARTGQGQGAAGGRRDLVAWLARATVSSRLAREASVRGRGGRQAGGRMRGCQTSRTAYSCQASLTPFRCSDPRSSKVDRRASGELTYRARDEDFSGAGECGDSGGYVDRDASYIVACELEFAGVTACPDLDAEGQHGLSYGLGAEHRACWAVELRAGRRRSCLRMCRRVGLSRLSRGCLRGETALQRSSPSSETFVVEPTMSVKSTSRARGRCGR